MFPTGLVWRQQSTKSIQNCQIVMVLCFIKTSRLFDNTAKITAVWDVYLHPPYSPDIVPLDFHLFRSLQNSLIGKNFISLED